MFEASLEDKLKRIFDLKKASFNVPSETQEQECIFIEVASAKSVVRDQAQLCKVSGQIKVFCNTQRMPYGYFLKKISMASADDVRDIAFFNLEENAGTNEGICQRTMDFVYFFRGQYDPNKGLITELKTIEAS